MSRTLAPDHARGTRRPALSRLVGRLLVVLTAATVALALPAAALGQDVPRLRDGVTDEADALTPAEEGAVADALRRLRDQTGVQLFVAFVDTTGDATVTEYTGETAEQSSLGGNDALLLVAMEDRSDALWVGPSLDDVTNDEIDAILTEVVEPRLADGRPAEATIAGAAAVGRAAVGELLTSAPATPAPASPGPTSTAATGTGGGSGEGTDEDGGGINITAVLVVLLLAVGLFLVWRAAWGRRATAAGGKGGKGTQDPLARDANRALLAADEALKDAANDVEFAAQQWGEPEAATYRAAIRAADAELRAAFEIRQRLDDAEPKSPPERERMLREIAARADAARKLVDEQEQRFDSLRDLEQAAPEQLAALPPLLESLRGRITASATTMERLTSAYAPSATASVTGNVAEATKAVESAEAETQRGRGLLEAQRNEAVVALRRAQEAVARAGLLLDAVDRLAAHLDDAAARVAPELEAATADVATARAAVTDPRRVPPAMPASPPGPGQATPAPSPTDAAASLAAAERLLGEARAAADARPLDPLVALERASTANQAADAIIAGLREAQAEAQRRLARATTAVATARGHVDRAVDFITTRRHGVGRTARTRAAEAEAQLAEAERLAGTDPDAAVAAAQRAIQLADDAYQRAASEFGAWNTGSSPVAGPYAPPPPGGGDVAGAIIGGIIGGILAGGGGPGWGGTPWGHPTQRPRGGGGWGGSRPAGRPSGWGGSRPSGGGGRSAGGGGGGTGGRVRGGRW